MSLVKSCNKWSFALIFQSKPSTNYVMIETYYSQGKDKCQNQKLSKEAFNN